MAVELLRGHSRPKVGQPREDNLATVAQHSREDGVTMEVRGCNGFAVFPEFQGLTYSKEAEMGCEILAPPGR